MKFQRERMEKNKEMFSKEAAETRDQQRREEAEARRRRIREANAELELKRKAAREAKGEVETDEQ